MADRILVYGVTGSGKSTAATRIGAATGLPVTLVDDLTWEPGWVAVPDDVQRERIAAVVAGERWVLDGAYSSWFDAVLERADLVVGLDYPRWLSMQRLVRRTLSRIVTRQEVCNGNQERWNNLFSRDSILVWHLQSFARKQRSMRAWAAETDAGGRRPAVLLFSRPRELDAWVRALSSAGGAGPTWGGCTP